MKSLFVDPLHALGTYGNALIVIWRQAPTVERLDGVMRAACSLIERFPDGIGVLGVSGGLPLTCADDRQRLGSLLQQRGDRLLGMASVIEGCERTRHLMASINMVVKQPCPLRIFSTVDEGVTWLAPLLAKGERPPAAALRQAVERLRRELFQAAGSSTILPN